MGHVRANYYKLHGYPADWKSKRRNNTAHISANHVGFNNTPGLPMHDQNTTNESSSSKFPPTVYSGVFCQQQQLHSHQQQFHPHFSPQQYMQLLKLIEPENAKINCDTTATAHASGIGTSLIPDADKWIIDTGASKHMVHNLNMLTQCSSLDKNMCNKVHLPTGHLAQVSQIGSSQVLEGAKISNVLHIPEFHYNILHVSMLTRELNCCAVFYHDHCVFQDLSNENVRGTGVTPLFLSLNILNFLLFF